jgi:hypothetical protein
VSADNWTVCPRCWDRAKCEAAEARANVMVLYGQIPVEEFDAKRAALTEPDPDDFSTFREDYEFYGAEEGEVKARYSGVCTVCGLAVELKEAKRFWEPGPRGESEAA